MNLLKYHSVPISLLVNFYSISLVSIFIHISAIINVSFLDCCNFIVGFCYQVFLWYEGFFYSDGAYFYKNRKKKYQ